MNIHEIYEIIEGNAKLYEILKYCPYEILKQWKVKSHPKGQVVFRQGEAYDYFYIIINGYLDIYVMAENGKRYSQAVYTTGNFIGELEIFDRKPFSCFVEAITEVRLLEIRREYFFLWLELDKNIGNYITKILCNQFYRLSKKAGQDTLYSLKQRLCYYLLSSANAEPGKKNRIDIEKNKLSEQLAVTQRSINRVLQYLKEKGIIEVDNNYIVIKDLDALAEEEEASRYE